MDDEEEIPETVEGQVKWFNDIYNREVEYKAEGLDSKETAIRLTNLEMYLCTVKYWTTSWERLTMWSYLPPTFDLFAADKDALKLGLVDSKRNITELGLAVVKDTFRCDKGYPVEILGYQLLNMSLEDKLDIRLKKDEGVPEYNAKKEWLRQMEEKEAEER